MRDTLPFCKCLLLDRYPLLPRERHLGKKLFMGSFKRTPEPSVRS